ncbi:hypothetical protein [Streptomyces niphimycinicus]|uniref:hypothetical protein n=1 Tax=Streptomyces niphimycinicus TaxID=2842201 RepID=UPI00209B5AC5|nr:hypothetical protein [Streptomyces niphimycinicus]
MLHDLSGHGNDLRVTRPHHSEPEILTWSGEHHGDQPAHAGLRFDGGKGPDRGAVLTTSATAPLNSEKFTGGYRGATATPERPPAGRPTSRRAASM